ncbi:DeoR/GlpR family DNA-binding transcription regulator [Oceanobacillus neutriphilus]|uniref:DeoR family transcriptional regulator n=1 Tax=Oceanobacillus neutriphilus TaxID=531815 RepID=A0ABQ2NVU0_9BACI|nr:DeoR/GlpR family DNA-binding transcription regulator [Oceanobacillus neutriphilus]GGP11802.1 DeoR family transcriptional regulator [Oceanobacillus neutriphilus]
MHSIKRQQMIENLIYKEKTITISQIAEKLQVSKPTVRNDIQKLLSNNSNIEKVHGGVSLKDDADIEFDYEKRKVKNRMKKIEIAKKIINIINEKNTILLDSSSTTYELAQLLSQTSKRITVITNGIQTALQLKKNPKLFVIVLGGSLTDSSNTIKDDFGENILNFFNIDYYFFSASGISLNRGFSEYNIHEIRTKQKHISIANKSIALIDETKFDKDSNANFASLEDVDLLVTNDSLPKDIYSEYKKRITFY